MQDKIEQIRHSRTGDYVGRIESRYDNGRIVSARAFASDGRMVASFQEGSGTTVHLSGVRSNYWPGTIVNQTDDETKSLLWEYYNSNHN